MALSGVQLSHKGHTLSRQRQQDFRLAASVSPTRSGNQANVILGIRVQLNAQNFADCFTLLQQTAWLEVTIARVLAVVDAVMLKDKRLVSYKFESYQKDTYQTIKLCIFGLAKLFSSQKTGTQHLDKEMTVSLSKIYIYLTRSIVAFDIYFEY